MKRVILLKEQSAEYQIALEQFQVEFQPVLSFEYFNLPELVEILSRPVQLIITSANALKAIQQVRSMLQLERITAFVVGKHTCKLAKELGFEPLGESTGNASELVRFIIDNQSVVLDRNLPLIWLRGNLADQTLISRLGDADIQVTDLVVYQTINVPIGVIKDAVVVVFSPSGLNSVQRFENCDFVSFGPTTRTELEKRSLCSIQVKEPTPQGVFDALKQLLE